MFICLNLQESQPENLKWVTQIKGSEPVPLVPWNKLPTKTFIKKRVLNVASILGCFKQAGINLSLSWLLLNKYQHAKFLKDLCSVRKPMFPKGISSWTSSSILQPENSCQITRILVVQRFLVAMRWSCHWSSLTWFRTSVNLLSYSVYESLD